MSYLFSILQGINFRIIRLIIIEPLTFREIKERLKDSKNNFALTYHLEILEEKRIIQKNYSSKRKAITYGLTNLGKHLHDLSFSLDYSWKIKVILYIILFQICLKGLIPAEVLSILIEL